jgi:exosortase E/protease (VPEID-CTERM system)
MRSDACGAEAERPDLSKEKLPAPHSIPPTRDSVAPPLPLVRWRIPPGRRILLLLAMVAAQVALLKLIIHPRTDGFFSVPGGLFQLMLYYSLGFCLLISTRVTALWCLLVDAAQEHRWQRRLMPQLASTFLLVYCASRLLPTSFSDAPDLAWPASAWWVGLLALAVGMSCCFALASIAPKSFWVRFMQTEWTTLLLAGVFPLSHFLVYTLIVRSEDWLAVPTVAVVKFLLDFVYVDVHADFPARVVGTPSFVAIIDHLCAGYEGIAMITVFLIWYLHSFRRDFRFPAALLLFPLAAVLIWLSNCLRIAVLVGIGTSMSSEVVMEGYHANGGWICFILVSLGMVALARRSSVFCCNAVHRTFVIDADSALVIPFLVMLAATLLTSAMSAGFPWLYPLRVLATAAAMALLWRRFRLAPLAPRLLPVLAGVLVFVLWIVLVPLSADADRAFSANLFAVPAVWSAVWIALRVAGAVVVIPIAEELAFRGYVPLFFRGGDHAFIPGGPIHWAPLIVSSLLFGALHSSWFAGALAGAVYYLVRQRSGRLWDSIVAHCTTNLLLSLYVLASGHWSYW